MIINASKYLDNKMYNLYNIIYLAHKFSQYL